MLGTVSLMTKEEKSRKTYEEAGAISLAIA